MPILTHESGDQKHAHSTVNREAMAGGKREAVRMTLEAAELATCTQYGQK